MKREFPADDFPRPLLLGHRGAAGEAPENTWPAFERARRSGAHGFEIDVLLTRDGAPVAVHDLTLKRVTGVRREIEDLTWPELRTLDVGGHFDPAFAGERVPRLEDVLDEFGGEMILDIELKGLNPFAGELEELVTRLLRERDLLDRVILSSFNPLIIRRIKALEPRVRTGFNYISDSILHLRRIWFGLFGYTYSKHPQPHQVDPAYVARQRRRGIRVIPWGANDPGEIRRLLELGVDGIISDFPGRLVKLVGGE